MSMQQMILSKIKSMFDEMADSTWSWVDKIEWSNTGKVYFYDQDLNTIGSFAYDFQNDYFSMVFYKGNVKPVMAIGFTPENSIGRVHGEYHSLSETVNKIRNCILKMFAEYYTGESHAAQHC